MNKLKFIKSDDAFAQDIREGLREYLARDRNRFGGVTMLLKSLVILSLYLIPIGLLSTGSVTAGWQVFILYMVCGIGMAGVGMNIMHDALHGSHSKIKSINNLMGNAINLIGASAMVWKIQHNVLHHTYTNITGADDDLNTNFLLRFSPDKPWHKIHQYQCIYAWFLYGLMTLQWVTIRDFVRIRTYRKMGLIKDTGSYRREIAYMVLCKLLYFTVSLVLPILMIAQPWWVVVVSFLCMHFVTGIIISVVFETAHITPDASYPKPDENGELPKHRSVYQLITTCNFAPNSGLLTWCIGGLNYQIEHHLMPHVSHIHYPELSRMVQRIAKKHDLPYLIHPTFVSAIKAHYLKLRNLGRRDEDANQFATPSKGLSALVKT